MFGSQTQKMEKNMHIITTIFAIALCVFIVDLISRFVDWFVSKLNQQAINIFNHK